MSSQTRSHAFLIVSCSLSIVLLFYLFSEVKFSLLISEFENINFFYVPILCLLVWLGLWIRAIRWRYLLPKNISFRAGDLYDATTLGLLSSLILPLRAGEIVRPWVLSRNASVSFSAALASIITERVFDVLAILFLCALSFSRLEHAPIFVVVGAKSLGVLCGIMIVIIIGSYYKPDLAVSLGQTICKRMLFFTQPSFIEKISKMWDEFVYGLMAISRFRDIAIVFLWSLLLWGAFSAYYQLGLWMFGREADLWVGITINVVVALAVAAPSAPGFLGTFQLGCVVALHNIYGFPEELALGYSVIVHVLQFVSMFILGFVVLRRKQLRFSDLKKE